MIERIIALKNVGKFHDYKASGDVTLRRLTLIFAPNGRGKTTLCDVLRSVASGRPEYLRGRQTLGTGGGNPEAVLRVDGANLTFNDAAWSGHAPDVAIFDSTFIHENVYAGDFVDRDHKRALHNVIVGTRGVDLANEVADLDAKIKHETKRIGDLEAQLRHKLLGGMDLTTFLGLVAIGDIDAQIATTEAEVGAGSRASELTAKAKLAKIECPALPDGLETLLMRELGELSPDAEDRVRDHLRDHTKAATERWISEGLDFVKAGECPFCQNHLEKLDLIGAYRTYFGESYRALRSDITAMTSTLDARFGEDPLLGIQRDLAANTTAEEFWKQFVFLEPAHIEFESDIRQPILTLREAGRAHLAAKQQAPVEAVKIGDDLRAAIQGLSEAGDRVAAYNAYVDQANAGIEKQKAEANETDLPSARKKLSLLRATEVRMSPEVDQLCSDYLKSVALKKTLEGDKRAAKGKLDQYTEQIFLKYQSQINALLDMFGAEFGITNTTRSYAGGTASSDYQLVINSTPVSLGGPDAPLETTGFRNTLSSGDRSTLALAFFLAQLDLDPNVSKKVVVFDDPFTSQDRSRRSCTQQLIRRKSTTAAQVIVLSHDPEFLKLVWEGHKPGDVKTLQLARAGQETVLREWDIEAETRPAYLHDQAKLKEFADSGQGDRKAVVRCIRPVLEGYMRLRAYPEFKQSEWLGDLIRNIRGATVGAPLSAFQGTLHVLEDINDFSKKHHHQDNPIAADSEPIDDGELLTYVKRTLAFVAS